MPSWSSNGGRSLSTASLSVVSVNLNMHLRVANIPANAGDSVLEAIRAVLRREQIDKDVVLTFTDGTVEGATPYPMIISRSYLWCPKVEADLTAAVAAAVPGLVPEITWDYPDEA